MKGNTDLDSAGHGPTTLSALSSHLVPTVPQGMSESPQGRVLGSHWLLRTGALKALGLPHAKRWTQRDCGQ